MELVGVFLPAEVVEMCLLRLDSAHAVVARFVCRLWKAFLPLPRKKAQRLSPEQFCSLLARQGILP